MILRGIAVFSVNQVLEPVPRECFTENLEKGDLLTSLPLAKGDAKHSTRVLAVEETYASEATDRETVAVKHAVRIDFGKWQCGSPMLKDGKIAAIFLNNGIPPDSEKLFGYAVPARYALQAFAELSGEQAAPSAPGKIAEPVFIVARHAMIYDGHVVTWDEIRDRIKKCRAGDPLFRDSNIPNGALDKLHDAQQERLQREFDFKEMNVGILSPRAGRRYDAVKSQADLSPKPPDARQGSVRVSNGRSHDGSPVVGAQVVLLPGEDFESGGGFAMTVRQGRLRTAYEEIVTETDAAGLFVVYPRGRFQLVVLHKDGFAVRTSDEFRNPVINARTVGPRRRHPRPPRQSETIGEPHVDRQPGESVAPDHADRLRRPHGQERLVSGRVRAAGRHCGAASHPRRKRPFVRPRRAVAPRRKARLRSAGHHWSNDRRGPSGA